MRRVAAVTAVLLGLLVPSAAVVPAQAHTPGAPRLEVAKLEPLVLTSSGVVVEISEDSFSAYYFERTGRSTRQGLFTICSHRALQVAFNKLWGRGEVPDRSDLAVTSYLAAPESVYFFELVAGSFELLRPDGTRVDDLKPENIFELARQVTAEDLRFVITRLSTGKSIELEVEAEMFPPGFWELRQKALFEDPAPPTREEVSRYTGLRIELAKELINADSWVLFKGTADMPFPVVGAVFVGGILVAILYSVIAFRRK
jgi:hypothetical protein